MPGKKYIIGIDEVGRGALAGPVVVAAVCLQAGKMRLVHGQPGILKDSKKLSAKQREQWIDYFISQPDFCFAVARVYPRQIEKNNISKAANIAALRALGKLKIAMAGKEIAGIFLDGGLYLGDKKQQKMNFPNATTRPKADEQIPAVSVASIVAKVHRDRFMKKVAKQYPTYGFEIHKGYGTKSHIAAMKKYGISEAHRATFCHFL